MSSNSATPALSTKAFFRNVNGEQLTLEEKGSSCADSIISFVLRSEKHFKVNLCLTLLCTILVAWSVSETTILFIVSVCILTLQYKSFVASTKQDTLLVVKSVGVYIESKRGLGISSSTEFLPWDTVEDIFINEVIKGRGFEEIDSIVSRSTTGKKMPGIHVPTFSQLDWLEQEKGSLLTVPGSYWLCHKKNIYKFIFRYHRTVKNATQFSYGRELLKVIRRIIKSHPTQGQQFGTQHLLVTYSCTSWTRQDKMFAILKFQQRTNAAAFSHAFVLTIRICSSSEQSFSLRYPIAKETDAGTTFKDLNESVNTEERPIKTIVDTTDKISSEKSTTYQDQREASEHDVIKDTSNETSETSVNTNPQIDIEKSAGTRESLDAGLKNTVTCTVNEEHLIDKHNVEFYDDAFANKSINFYAERFETDMRQHSIDHRQEQSLQAIKKDAIETKKSDGKDQQIRCAKGQEQYQEIQDIGQYNAFSSSKTLIDTTKSGADVDRSLSNECGLDENSIEGHMYAVDNEDSLNHKKRTGENIVDSSNIPYQYFIEKEIENSKCNRKTVTFSPIIGKVIEKDLPQQDKHETEFVNEDSIPKVIKNSNDGATQNENCNKVTDFPSQENDKRNIPILMKTDDNRAQNNAHKSYKNRKQKSRDSEKKTVADEKVLRSSNITDLVMEGLMFTIRQDRDSVAVIEQKTKLEMDEVLENSEKVETKAGEKCLLNSSLLRLENLITMIDSPRDKHKRHKSSHAIGSNMYSSPFNVLADNAVHKLDDINYIDREMNKATVPSYDKRSTTDQLNSCESLWQNQCAYSSIINNDDYSTSGNAINKREQFMEREDDGSERDRGHTPKDDTAMEEEKEEEEEEDIIPEFFQPTTSSLERTTPKEQFAGLQNSDLLMDDMEMEKAAICNVLIEEYDSFSSLCPSSSSSKMTMKEVSTVSEESRPIKRQSNVPRVVSNKAITVEQMPLALQKVLRHTCRRRGFLSTDNDEILPVHQRKMQRTKNAIFTKSVISEASDSSEEQSIDSNVANKSLSIKTSNDIEETKSNKADSCAVNDKKTSEEDSNKYVKNIKKRDNETCGVSQTSLSLQHSLPRKLQDITEDFYYDLQAHKKDNAIRQRCLRKRRKSLNNPDDIKNSKVRIEMLKFIQDMTEGAKVVVKRLNIADKSNLLEKNIASTTCKH